MRPTMSQTYRDDIGQMTLDRRRPFRVTLLQRAKGALHLVSAFDVARRLRARVQHGVTARRRGVS